MYITYASKKLKKLLTNKSKLQQKYGQQMAAIITQRMAEIDAADNLSLMPPAARVHPREPKDKGLFSVDILKHNHPTRLIIMATGSYDLAFNATIVSVEIQEINKNTH